MKGCRTCTRELIGEEVIGGQCFVCRSADPEVFLEAQRVHWRRDWDAVLIGFVLGVLITLVVT